MGRAKVIGGGLAGCEAAAGLARRGHEVDLFEMRPVKSTEAHAGSDLAELVCSNSFRSDATTNAVGLLKREMEMLGSVILRCGAGARVPAGDAFAVDRERFSSLVTAAIEETPGVRVHRGEVTGLDLEGYDVLVVATGPLTSDPLFDSINAR